MRYIKIIIITLIASYSHAQTYIELSIPVGVSYVTQSSIDRVDNIVGANNVEWNSGFYKGLEGGLAFHLSDKFIIKGYLNYLVLQNNLAETEERESYSWTYRKREYRVNEHNVGIGLSAYFRIMNNGVHSLAPFFGIGLNSVFYNDARISEERINYFSPERESFEGRVSEQTTGNHYLNPRIGLSYRVRINQRLFLFSDVGYSYFYNMNDDLMRGDDAIDWNSFYVNIGAGWDLISQ